MRETVTVYFVDASIGAVMNVRFLLHSEMEFQLQLTFPVETVETWNWHISDIWVQVEPTINVQKHRSEIRYQNIKDGFLGSRQQMQFFESRPEITIQQALFKGETWFMLKHQICSKEPYNVSYIVPWLHLTISAAICCINTDFNKYDGRMFFFFEFPATTSSLLFSLLSKMIDCCNGSKKKQHLSSPMLCLLHC